MKMLLRLVVALVVLVIVGVLAVFYFIDAIAKSAVERGGTYALGVPTTLQSADVGVTTGEFSMEKLKVANPTGFDTPHFLTLGDGAVSVSFGSLREETVELPTLSLKTIDVNLEKKKDSSNYNVILANVKRLQSDKPAEGGKRFIVKDLLIQDVNIHADVLPIGGEAARMNFQIPEIRLQNVGSETGKGVLLSELAGVIVQAVLKAVVEKGGQLLPGDLLNDLSGGLDQLKSLGDMGINMAADTAKVVEGVASKAGDAAKEVTEKLGDKVKEVEEGIGDAVKGIGDLIPKKK